VFERALELAKVRTYRTKVVRLKDDPEALIFTKKNGTAILRFDKAWWTACRAAGIPDRVEKRERPNGKVITKVTCGRIFHDFRRTAVRNLENAGVPRSQAMRLVGHKTEAISNRYAISNENDLREAVRKLDAADGV
jgi:integrase